MSIIKDLIDKMKQNIEERSNINKDVSQDEITKDNYLRSLRRERRMQLEEMEKEKLKREIEMFKKEKQRKYLWSLKSVKEKKYNNLNRRKNIKQEFIARYKL